MVEWFGHCNASQPAAHNRRNLWGTAADFWPVQRVAVRLRWELKKVSRISLFVFCSFATAFAGVPASRHVVVVVEENHGYN
ncbi:MAG TPA: hypothetical protein VGG15_00305, partial [Terriglobales bacterium]